MYIAAHCNMQILIIPVSSSSKSNDNYHLWKTHIMPGPALDTLPAKTKNSFQKPDDETDSAGSGYAPTPPKRNKTVSLG